MKTPVSLVSTLLLGLAVVPGGPSLEAADPPLLATLRTELNRNAEVLQREDVPAYFISYTVYDTHSRRLVASFGALQRNDDERRRFAAVQVRVGDYALDNTHPIRGEAAGQPSGLTRIALPLTDDAVPVRAALWRATDRSFKQAVQALTRVKTNIASKVKEESPTPDFSPADPQQSVSTPVAFPPLDAAAWEARLRRVSAPFASDALILRSEVSLQVDATTRYYTDTEGAQVQTSELGYRLFIQGLTKADDGMELPLYTSYFARAESGLPTEAALLEEVQRMTGLLAQLRKAPLVEPFTGPAVLSGRAAGVFFHEIFGHRVEGHRQKDVNDGQTFAKRLNQNVLPPFLSVVFDPTQRRLGNTDLMGHYLYDDEGVQARPVTVIDRGILKTFLVDRAPLTDFPQSNGHGRAEPGLQPVSRQSNLIVQSANSVAFEDLMSMLKAEARKQGKTFGLLFENIEGGFTTTGRGGANAFNVLPNLVYRIYTDDRPPELVRGVDLIGTPLSAFGKIVATGDKTDIFNGMCGAESGNVPVSASSPPLLVSEVEVQKKAQSQEALPILPAPSAGGKS
ncbi:MAG: metallopeptidase TldD-related protein [Vicinamibacterales bacterium]